MAVKVRKTVEQKDIGKHIKEVTDYITSRDMAVTADTTSGASTYTGAGVVNGVILRSGNTSGVTDVTPTATLLLASMNNPAIGDTFVFYVRNLNTSTGTVTLSGGTNVTLSGTTTCAINKTRMYVGAVTAVTTPAVTLYGVMLGDV